MAKQTELVIPDKGPPPQKSTPTVEELLQSAVERGLDPEGLTTLVALHERVEANRASKAFAEAMLRFQRDCPTIRKNKTAKAGQYSYDYTSLDYVVNTIRPHLDRHGLSYSFNQRFEDKTITVTTTIRHVAGHKETSTFSAPFADTGRMNDIQKVASASSYAKRYGLLDALGIATGDKDDDGNAAGTEPITEHQLAEIQAVVDELNFSADREKRFLQFMGVEQLADIPRRDYTKACRALEAARRVGR